jgi:hypothetical protein
MIKTSDIQFIVDDLFDCKSAVSNLSGVNHRLICVRWDKQRRPAVNNLIPITESEANRHYSAEGFSAWPQETIERINEILSRAPQVLER